MGRIQTLIWFWSKKEISEVRIVGVSIDTIWSCTVNVNHIKLKYFFVVSDTFTDLGNIQIYLSSGKRPIGTKFIGNGNERPKFVFDYGSVVFDELESTRKSVRFNTTLP